IPVFNRGKMIRDFTYVDDIVDGLVRVIDTVPEPNLGWSGDRPDPATSNAPNRIYNIGNNKPVQLMHYIEVLESCLGKKAKLEFLPMQDGDVPATEADVSELEKELNYRPTVTVEEGIARFVDWYTEYYK
ncbi:MAG: GDP-mannose 4,6-dehydratase, partial [Gammaproteobacteria bacterium]|nr:GDP-mannose 4,6-dehydratase [Gammaproteobacteria bacterium]